MWACDARSVATDFALNQPHEFIINYLSISLPWAPRPLGARWSVCVFELALHKVRLGTALHDVCRMRIPKSWQWGVAPLHRGQFAQLVLHSGAHQRELLAAAELCKQSAVVRSTDRACSRE